MRKRRSRPPQVVRLSAVRRGYLAGRRAGYDEGFRTGYERAFGEHRPFAGTSIVIPTYNQRDYLQLCIESIGEYTPEPHEIIVVDNASQDGTADYLASLGGRVRYLINAENLGFAGAVNQGLRLARGQTLLFLNNDTLVTRGWLGNLLTCVGSREEIGFAGPVTNYISGDQLLPVSYGSTEEMHAFAAANNRSDPASWLSTARLTGFCVAMRREVFERLGYMDEGFEVGNCEDDDYGLRVRLLGYETVIAKDTFIHHFGSVSMKALGSSFDEVYARNLAFYAEKWEDPHNLLEELRARSAGIRLRSVHMYPTHVPVCDGSGQTYWIENGRIHPVAGGPLPWPAVRVSAFDVRGWAADAALPVEEVLRRSAALGEPPVSGWRDGMLAHDASGELLQYERGTWRTFVSARARSVWNPAALPVYPLAPGERERYPAGLPIIAPPVLRSPLL